MRRAYRLLLRLYPREQRLRFGPEMLDVFTQACLEHREQGWFACAGFVAKECIGLVAGALGGRPRVSVAPAVGGVVLAVILHAVSYTALSRVSRATSATLARSFIPRLDPPAALVLMVVVSVLYLLLFSLLSVRMLQRRR